MRYIVACCCVMLLLAGLPERGHAATEIPTQTVNRVVAVANGEIITMFDLEMASTPDLMQARLDPRNPANAERVQEILRKNLETMITDILVVHEAERLKIGASPADVDAELQQMVKRSNMSEEELLGQLSKQGMSREQVRERLRKRVLQQRLMANMVGRKVIVSKDEVAEYFAKHGSVSTGGSVDFAVLVYSPKVKALDWAARIRAGKISFEDAVSKVSVGPNRTSGGRLAPMKMAETIPLVRAQLENLRPGQVSEVFELDGMKTQIKLLHEDKGTVYATLEEAAPIIEERLRGPKLEERYKEYLEQLRKKALVDIRL